MPVDRPGVFQVTTFQFYSKWTVAWVSFCSIWKDNHGRVGPGMCIYCLPMMAIIWLICDQYLLYIWQIFVYIWSIFVQYLLNIWPIFGTIIMGELDWEAWYVHTLPTDARSAAGGSWARLENWLCTSVQHLHANTNAVLCCAQFYTDDYKDKDKFVSVHILKKN